MQSLTSILKQAASKPIELNTGCSRCKKKQKASIIIPAYNEGLEVGKTVEDIREKHKNLILEFVVVDDGSTDGSCDNLRAKVIRHKKRLGPGQSRDDGALAASFDNLAFIDAHMRKQYGNLQMMFDVANETNGWVCCRCSSGNGGTTAPSGARVGFFESIDKNNKTMPSRISAVDGIPEPKWHSAIRMKGDVWRIPALMGGCYVVNKKTYEKTGGVHNIAGKTFYAETCIATRCFYLDIPIWAVRKTCLSHLYGSKKGVQYPLDGNDRIKNAAQLFFTVSHPDTYKYVWRPRFKVWLTEQELSVIERKFKEEHKEFQKKKLHTDAEYIAYFLYGCQVVDASRDGAVYKIKIDYANTAQPLPIYKGVMS